MSRVITPERFKELKRILTERRNEILAQVQAREQDWRLNDLTGSIPNVGSGDPADRAEAERQLTVTSLVSVIQSGTLGMIDDALRRLERHSFGYCEECGDEIEEKRLRALPFAVRCKDCERAHELAQAAEARPKRRVT